jgi:uncharacterized peroxidase-related enzyme
MTLRLRILEDGHKWPKRLMIRAVERLSGSRFDDVPRVVLYRPMFFGRSWIRLTREVMRGPSEWTPGERELIAAFISRRNQCPFCVGIHTRTASLGLGRSVATADLDGWRDTPLGPRMRAALELLERRGDEPDDLAREDFDRARAAGLSEDAIVDLLYVAFVFDLINRLANAFAFSWVDETGRESIASSLHRVGYRVPGFLLR